MPVLGASIFATMGRLAGALNGNFKVKAFTDITQAIDGAKFLVVTTTSKGHRPMAELLKGKLRKGKRIVIIIGNWGAYEFYSVLRDEVREKHIIIGETSGNLAAFPEFYAVSNVLDTSINNTNPSVHVPFCIFNITRMANGEDTQFYGECLPPILLDFVVAADAERCAVAKAIGGEAKSILDLMNAAWKVNYDNIKDLGLENASLKSVKLPKDPYHRFLTEDVPYGYMAVSRLGKKYNVPTPRINLLVDAYRYLLADRAELDGPEFNVDMQEVL